MTALKERVLTPELMDDPDLSANELDLALAGLRRLNYISFGAYHLFHAIHALAKKRSATIRLLDIGSGDGQVLCKVVLSLLKKGIKISAIGTDINPLSVKRAADYAMHRKIPVEFMQYDAIEALNKFHYDIVTSSLFLHHLKEDALKSVFQIAKEKASLGIVMNDLERSKSGYYMVKFASRLLSKSRIVRYDGPQSVRAAFSIPEIKALTKNLPGVKIYKAFPCKMIINWQRT